MKHHVIPRILVTSVTLVLLAVCPALSLHAAGAVITLLPEEGEVGDRIDIEGQGFAADGLYRIYFSSNEAIAGEHYETTSMYPEFEAEAKAEGNKAAANLFRQIAKIEAEHRDRYKKLLGMVINGTVFKRDEPITWKCSASWSWKIQRLV